VSEYTPTTEDVFQAIQYGRYERVGFGYVYMSRSEFDRWREREREAAHLDGRIEERDALRAKDAEVRAQALEAIEAVRALVMNTDGDYLAGEDFNGLAGCIQQALAEHGLLPDAIEKAEAQS
jgi:hypothetical protein